MRRIGGPLTQFFRIAAKESLRRLSTPAGESAATSGVQVVVPKTMVTMPTWAFVALGVASAGFFVNILHKDNLATRQESREDNQAARKEWQDSMQSLERKVEKGFQEVTEDLAALKSASR